MHQELTSILEDFSKALYELQSTIETINQEPNESPSLSMGVSHPLTTQGRGVHIKLERIRTTSSRHGTFG